VFFTCFYTSFLACDFLSFCIDSLYTCSYSHLPLHTRHLFAEIAYQITQVPRVFDTRFLWFYTTCAFRFTCQNQQTETNPLLLEGVEPLQPRSVILRSRQHQHQQRRRRLLQIRLHNHLQPQHIYLRMLHQLRS